MTDEYIRRRDVLKGKKTGTFANGICIVAEPCVTVKYIESIEPADVIPVVHGKWINTAPRYRSDNIICDHCGYDSIVAYRYCPSCGAKMDGEE